MRSGMFMKGEFFLLADGQDRTLREHTIRPSLQRFLRPLLKSSEMNARHDFIIFLCRRYPFSVVLACLWLFLSCGGRLPENVVPPTPPPELYDRPSDFSGTWLGESAGVMGTLTIKPLGQGRYYGSFISDDAASSYVANMKQIFVEPKNGEEAQPSNLMTFSWRDGQTEDICTETGCGHGLGWVMINPEESALTGMIGYGQSNANGGSWSFIRVDDDVGE